MWDIIAKLAGAGLGIAGAGMEGRARKKAYERYYQGQKAAQQAIADRINMSEEQMRLARGDTEEFQRLMREALAAREGRVSPLLDVMSPERLTEMYNLARSPIEIGEQQGYSPEVLAAMRGQAIDVVPGRYEAALRQAKLAAARRGLAYTPGLGQILAAKEAERAGALRNIAIQNEQQRLQNIENARKFGLSQRELQLGGMGSAFSSGTNLLNQIGSIYNPTAYIPGYSSAIGATSDFARTAMTGAGYYAGAVPQMYQGGSTWGSVLGAAGGALSSEPWKTSRQTTPSP